jgi:Arc/MetJ family transcription regulator
MQSKNTRKTSVEINEELFAAAQKILGTRTIKDTIEAALHEVVRTQARREEVEALSEMKGLDLADADVMAKAWRS